MNRTRCSALLGIAILAVTLSKALVIQGEPSGRPQSQFAGVISCSTCRARHKMNSGKSPAECTVACIRKGAGYVLVSGDKVYALQGNTSELGRFAGQRVKIEGGLEGNSIRVVAVSPGI